MGPSRWRACPLTVLLIGQHPAGTLLAVSVWLSSSPLIPLCSLHLGLRMTTFFLPAPTSLQSCLRAWESMGLDSPHEDSFLQYLQAAMSSPDQEPKYDTASVSSMLPAPSAFTDS